MITIPGTGDHDERNTQLRARVLEMAESAIQPERADGVPFETIRALQELHRRGDIGDRDTLAENSTRAGLEGFDEVVADYNRRWHDYAAGFRVLALSREANHPLMWAHYARGHQGAVLRFRPVAGSESEIDRAAPVQYSDEVPYASNLEQFVNRLTGFPDYQDPDVFRRYLLTKATCWGYENEYRVLKRAGADVGEASLIGIRPEELEGLVLGNRMQEADREVARRFMRERWPNAGLYHAVKVRGRFQLDIAELL